MYAAIIAQFDASLANLDGFLSKAEAHAVAHNFSPDVFMTGRLAPDMFPFSKQMQIACDAAKITAARVADVPPPSFPDDEKDLAELHARIAKTRAFLQSVDLHSAAAQDGQRRVSPGYPPDKTMSLHDYVIRRQIANFYFHVTTAYALLRAWGVPLGKGDYLGALPLE